MWNLNWMKMSRITDHFLRTPPFFKTTRTTGGKGSFLQYLYTTKAARDDVLPSTTPVPLNSSVYPAQHTTDFHQFFFKSPWDPLPSILSPPLILITTDEKKWCDDRWVGWSMKSTVPPSISSMKRRWASCGVDDVLLLLFSSFLLLGLRLELELEWQVGSINVEFWSEVRGISIKREAEIRRRRLDLGSNCRKRMKCETNESYVQWASEWMKGANWIAAMCVDPLLPIVWSIQIQNQMVSSAVRCMSEIRKSAFKS